MSRRIALSVIAACAALSVTPAFADNDCFDPTTCPPAEETLAREQRGEHGRAGVQYHATHVGVVVVEHVSHLAVGKRRIEQADWEFELQPGFCLNVCGWVVDQDERSGVWIGDTVALTSDGGRLATAGDESVVHWWDTTSGKQMERLTGHTGAVLAMVGADDGTFLTASADTTVQLRADGLPVGIVSVGGSGSYIQAAHIPGVTELKNLAYLDSFIDNRKKRVHDVEVIDTIAFYIKWGSPSKITIEKDIDRKSVV